MKERRNYKELFKEQGYSVDEIKIHYDYIKRKNDFSKERLSHIKNKYEREILKAKKYFKRVNPSLKGDGLWIINKYGRVFIYWNELEYYIEMENK